MKKYNIVFLDFDGVLNGISMREWKENRYSLDKELGGLLSKNIPDYHTEWQHFDADIFYSKLKILIRALKNIPDVKIVLSTSWRKLKEVHEFERVFKTIPDWTFDIIGRTGNHEHNKRGHEIESWLQHNKNIVENYIIIDDETVDMLPSQKNKIVKTSVYLGISRKDAYIIESLIHKYDKNGNIKTIRRK